MSRFYLFSAHLYPRRDKPKRIKNATKGLHEIKTDGVDLTDGLKVVDIGRLEDLNNPKINVFELNEDKTIAQLYLSKNMKKLTTLLKTVMGKSMNIFLIMSKKFLFNNVKRLLIYVYIKINIF